MKKYTIADFNKLFQDDAACLEWLKNYLYPDGIFCKKCEMFTPHSRLTTRKAYSCNRCGKEVYPMAGTIFNRSRTPLKHWFYAMFLMSQTRSGISAKQLQRELGVTYKTAWRMFHEIRCIMKDKSQKLSGEVEIDETYVGGKRHGKAGRGAAGKTIVLGMIQRKGGISAIKVKDIKRDTITPIIKKRVTGKSSIYTDECSSYGELKNQGYRHHKSINHKEKWVSGKVHINSIEGFWSALKRGIDGVYHAVSAQHLQSYINEYQFRYNHRLDEQPLFLTLLEKV
jgi:transposase